MSSMDIDEVLKENGKEDLIEKRVSVVRTFDGKLEHMPWSKVHYGMTELADGYCVGYRWKSLQFTTFASLWKDNKGKTYAAAGSCLRPSDCPEKLKSVTMIPVYFEELSSEEAEKMVQDAFAKKIQREREIARAGSQFSSRC